LETKETTNSQGNTQQKKQCWRYHNTDFKLYYKAVTIKTAWYWHKNRHEDQWNRIEDGDINPHNYTHLIFDKDAKNIGQPLQQMFLGKVVIHLQETETDPCLSPFTSINSKWIKDLNIRLITLKLLQEGAGNTLEQIGIGKNFLNTTPAA
jgi:hypothetical protein